MCLYILHPLNQMEVHCLLSDSCDLGIKIQEQPGPGALGSESQETREVAVNVDGL